MIEEQMCLFSGQYNLDVCFLQSSSDNYCHSVNGESHKEVFMKWVGILDNLD